MSKRSACEMNSRPTLKLATSFALTSYPRIDIAVGLKGEEPEIRIRQNGQKDFLLTLAELKNIYDGTNVEPGMDRLQLSFHTCELTGDVEVTQIVLEDGRYVFQKKIVPPRCPMDSLEEMLSVTACFYIPDSAIVSLKAQSENAYIHAGLIIETIEAIRGMYSILLSRFNNVVDSTNYLILHTEEEYDEIARRVRVYTPSFIIVRDFARFLKQHNLDCVFCYYSVMENVIANHTHLKSQLNSASSSDLFQ